MNMKFCDLCGEQANENLCRWLETKHGEPYGQTLVDLPKQCLIVTNISFSFERHPNGYGGPPDLCSACAANMVHELANRMERQP